MSLLIQTLLDQLNTVGQFHLLGTDGYIINAMNCGGVYALEVLNQNGTPVLNCYSELPRIIAQIKAHVVL